MALSNDRKRVYYAEGQTGRSVNPAANYTRHGYGLRFLSPLPAGEGWGSILLTLERQRLLPQGEGWDEGILKSAIHDRLQYILKRSYFITLAD